jgi:hypothetical protein
VFQQTTTRHKSTPRGQADLSSAKNWVGSPVTTVEEGHFGAPLSLVISAFGPYGQPADGPTVSCPSVDLSEPVSSTTSDGLVDSKNGAAVNDTYDPWLGMSANEDPVDFGNDLNALHSVPDFETVNQWRLASRSWESEDALDSLFSVDESKQSDDSSQFEVVESQKAASSRGKRSSPTQPGLRGFFTPSPETTAELMVKTNKSLISDSLGRIYHDTMENALCCWLTERACPYTYEGIVDVGQRLQESPQPEAFANQKNRMIARICRLDRSTCVLRERPLTQSEDRAASRALKAAVLAFASQWARSANLSAETQSFNDLHNIIDGSSPSPAQAQEDKGLRSFERSLQETLWHEAQRVLQETAEIDSFRVIFAQFIFSFTQRPLKRDHHAKLLQMRARQQNATPHGGPDTSSKDNGEPGGLRELLELEGPPIYFEAALMRLSAKRLRLEEMRAGLQPGHAHPMNITDRKTFNLLFWIVVMCDTLLAALYRRPYIVSDEDSLILRAEAPQNPFRAPEAPVVDPGREKIPSPDTEDADHTPWGSLFLEKTKIVPDDAPSSTWPFVDEYANAALSHAAAVKVLLYRKVKRLRNLIFRRSSAKKIEAAIVEGLTVYEYWNKTFGDFVLACIRHHEDLSPRIQSWYSVLLGHWHLAVFLLSDCIEEVDGQQKGDRLYGSLRQTCHLVFEMRKLSAFQVADIYSVAKPRHGSSFNLANDFHTTVNQGAILTEPWTEILIRCFARGADEFLGWLSDYQSGHAPYLSRLGVDDLNRLYSNCLGCIGCLFDLGRKSDMAYLAALSFSERLQKIQHLQPHADPRYV